jgi:hypothetical protein
VLQSSGGSGVVVGSARHYQGTLGIEKAESEEARNYQGVDGPSLDGTRRGTPLKEPPDRLLYFLEGLIGRKIASGEEGMVASGSGIEDAALPEDRRLATGASEIYGEKSHGPPDTPR